MRSVGSGQQDPLEPLAARWVEHQELPLAGIDLERVVARQARDRVRMKSGAVHHQAGAYAFSRGALQYEATLIAPHGGHPEAGPQLRAVTPGRQREGERVRDRVGDRFSRHLQRAVLAEQHLDAVALRVRGQRSHHVAARVARAQARPATQHRHTEGAEHGSLSAAERRISSVSSSPGTESNPVWRIPEFVPLAARPGSVSASRNDDRNAPARQRQGGRGAHHTGPDDRHLSVRGCRQNVLNESVY